MREKPVKIRRFTQVDDLRKSAGVDLCASCSRCGVKRCRLKYCNEVYEQQVSVRAKSVLENLMQQCNNEILFTLSEAIRENLSREWKDNENATKFQLKHIQKL